MKSKSIYAIIFLYSILLIGCENNLRNGLPGNLGTATTINISTFTPSIGHSTSKIYTDSLTNTVPYTPTASNTDTPLKTLTPTVSTSTFKIPHIIAAYSDIENGDIYVVEPPAQPRQIVSEIGPHFLFSYDAKKILYTNYSDPNILSLYVIDSDGSGERTLLTINQVSSLEESDGNMWGYAILWASVVWIPGTHSILFSTSGQIAQQGQVPSYDLFFLNTDTGVKKRIFGRWSGGYASPSPDGKKITIAKDYVVSVNLLDGTEIKGNVFTGLNSHACNVRYWGGYPETVWAMDSSRFGVITTSNNCYYSYSFLRDKINSSDASIWIVDGKTGAASLMGKVNNFGYGHLSPTLDRIEFTRLGTEPSTDETVLASFDGLELLRLSTGPTAFVSFSPDGVHFALYIEEKNQVFIDSIDGNIFALPTDTYPYKIQWINNSQFVFIENNNLMLGDIEGNTTKIITSDYNIWTFDARDLDYR